ncbi:MAG TPA: MarR family transcriptional regulator [Lachnospiraceae bacterium]|nr:MarR family transcriptional regulator [Lachnospiraceae bacterium]
MVAEKTLNSLLVELFKDIMEIEEKKLITEEFRDITYNDMHVIEAIGLEDSKKMSQIAKLMSVTMGTLTKAVDSLCDKGYVERKRSRRDKRVVLVRLTERGVKAYHHHETFHKEMISHILEEIDEEESKVLITTLSRLVDYFREKY